MSEREPYIPTLATVKDCYMFAAEFDNVYQQQASDEFQRFLSKFYESAREDEKYNRDNKYK